MFSLDPAADAKVFAGDELKKGLVAGLALAAFHNMRKDTTCDLLRQITENVLRDESRHVAFGNVYVGEAIREMHPDEQEDIAQFSFDVIKMMSDSMGGVDGTGARTPDPGFLTVLDKVGIDPGDFIKSLIEMGAAGIDAATPPDRLHSFKDLMMPALVRVGAITDRSRELYKEAGIPVWDDLTILESMEDVETGVSDFDSIA